MRIKFIKTTTDVYLTLNSVKHTSGSCWYLANKLVLCKWCVFFFNSNRRKKKSCKRRTRQKKQSFLFEWNALCIVLLEFSLVYNSAEIRKTERVLLKHQQQRLALLLAELHSVLISMTFSLFSSPPSDSLHQRNVTTFPSCFTRLFPIYFSSSSSSFSLNAKTELWKYSRLRCTTQRTFLKKPSRWVAAVP